MPKIGGVIRARVVYADLANTDQACAIVRNAVHHARAAWVKARAAFANQALPAPRPVLSIRYVWIGIDWLEAALRSLGGLRVPLAVPPDVAYPERYILGIWRPDLSSVEACWGVGTPGALEALSAKWASLWEQMTDLLQCGQPVAPKEYWPQDVPPIYEQAPVEAEAPRDETAATGRDEGDLTET